jgi:hypothetical protein
MGWEPPAYPISTRVTSREWESLGYKSHFHLILLSQNSFPSSLMAAVPASDATLAYPFGPGHVAHLTTPYADGDMGMLGPYLNLHSTAGATT